MSARVLMRAELLHSHRVRVIARALRADPAFKEWVKRPETIDAAELIAGFVVAHLLQVWAVAQSVATAGVFPRSTPADIDRIAGVPGFASAMAEGGYLSVRPDGAVELPNFPEHNPPAPPPGKKRASRVGPAAGDPPGFADWYAIYPRKKARKAARDAWAKLNPDLALMATMTAAVCAQKHCAEWREGVIPHPATWINGRRWEDEVAPPPPTQKDLAEKLKQQAAQRRAEAPAAEVLLAGEDIRKLLQKAKQQKGIGDA